MANYEDLPPETTALVRRQCTAMLSDRSRRCRRAPLWGSNVCSKHGAGRPAVKRKAAERLREMIDPALNNLRRAMESKDMSAVVRACLGVLALNGYRPGEAPPEEKPTAQMLANRSVDEIAAENEEIIRILRERQAKPPVVEGVVMLPEPKVIETSTPEETA